VNRHPPLFCAGTRTLEEKGVIKGYTGQLSRRTRLLAAGDRTGTHKAEQSTTGEVVKLFEKEGA